jgi:phosphatidylglycerophosphate synthase
MQTDTAPPPPEAETRVPARRPLRSRDTRLAHAAAELLARRGVTPNQISIASVVCAALAATLLPVGTLVPTGVGTCALLLAAVFVQLRLACNLLDGMVAVEGGRKTRSGDVYNELPDRVADVLVLVSAGYATSALSGVGPPLGWIAAILAMATAWVRAFGASLGFAQDFGGPMAKPHRMAVVTGACVAAAILPAGWRAGVVLLALAVVVVGSAFTVWLRTARLIKNLESR